MLTIYTHLETDMGERVHAQKCVNLLRQGKLVDIPNLMGKERYEKYANLNLSLAQAGEKPVQHETQREGVALTWSAGLSALYGHGINPKIAKLYAHLPTEKILSPLYEDVPLIITESLLGNERAQAYGLENVLYIPHHFTEIPRKVQKKEKRIVIGCVSRLDFWKNVEFAIEAAHELSKKHDILFVLKGDHPKNQLYPEYQQMLKKKIEEYLDEPWFSWDPSFTPYPAVLEEYACFDFCIQPSGSESGSNTVVDLLGLGIPVIVLEASSNPYLFKEGALFAQKAGEPILAQLPFYQPSLDSLVSCAERLMDEKQRSYWSCQAKKIAEERFHPSIAKRRLAVMLESSSDRAILKKLYDQDRTLYRL